MECKQGGIVEAEENTGLPLAWKRGANLPQTGTQRPAKREADRPPELNLGDIAPERASIFLRQLVEPIPNWLAPG
jgi:hypothetical protein